MIYSFQSALSGIVVLKGNLCEIRAIIKPSAASPELMKHTGKGGVFDRHLTSFIKIENR